MLGVKGGCGRWPLSNIPASPHLTATEASTNGLECKPTTSGGGGAYLDDGLVPPYSPYTPAVTLEGTQIYYANYGTREDFDKFREDFGVSLQ